MKKKTPKKLKSKGAISTLLIEQEINYCSFTFKNSYTLRPKSYPFIAGASTAARSRGKL